MGLSAEFMNEFEQEIEMLADVVDETRIAPETETMNVNDKQRSMISSFVITNITNACKSPISTESTAGNALLKVVKPYTGIAQLPVEQKTVKIKGLLLDIRKEENAQYVTDLNLTTYLNELETANNAYMASMQQRLRTRAALKRESGSAIRERDIRRMVSYSSVAQIGYIYAGLGLGTGMGFVAAIYHMLMHACAKSALFISSSGLADASGTSKRFSDLRGAGFRNPAAGVCFSVAAMSLVGIPVLGGFISKLYLSNAALYRGGLHMWVMLAALAVSTLLNVLYFMKTVITLYRPPREGFQTPAPERSPLSSAAMWGFVALNLLVGLMAQPIVTAITNGLMMFE